MNAEQALVPSPSKPMAFYIASAVTGIAAGGLGIGALVSAHEVRTAHTSVEQAESEHAITDAEAQEPVFAGLPTPTTLPDMDDDGVFSCSTYERHAQKGLLDEQDYLGVLACEQYLRDPRITVVDFAGQSDEHLQTYVDKLDVRGRTIGLLDEPTFTVIPATKEMQRAYQMSRAKQCDIFKSDDDPDTDDMPSTASDIARQFIPQKSYDRLIALTSRPACGASDGLAAGGTASGGEIDLYGVDLSKQWHMSAVTEASLHEFAHGQLGHSGSLSMGDDDPTIQLPNMHGGMYDLQGAIVNSNGFDQYGGDGIMSRQKLARDLNPVQQYELQWPERVLGKHEDHLVHLQEAAATFTSTSTPKDLAMVEFAEPVLLPFDMHHARTQEQKDYVKKQPRQDVDELYFVANNACTEQPSRTASTTVSIYARESISGDVVRIAVVAPMLDEPEAASEDDFDYEDYGVCQPSAELIKRDYAASLHIGKDQYVTLSYDGNTNEVSISKVFTPDRSGELIAE